MLYSITRPGEVSVTLYLNVSDYLIFDSKIMNTKKVGFKESSPSDSQPPERKTHVSMLHIDDYVMLVFLNRSLND